MVIDATFYAFAIPAALFAGISKGGFGSGAAFAAAPFLALILEPLEAVAIMLPVLMAIDAVTLRPYWRQWSWLHAKALIIGAVPGVLLGAALYSVISADVVRLLIGSVAIGYVSFELMGAAGWLHPSPKRAGAKTGYFWGMAAGFTSFISHAGGPPAAVYLLGQGLDKLRFQATTVIVFGVINAMKFGLYTGVGMFTAQTLFASMTLAPVGMLGGLAGVVAHRMISPAWFFRLTYLFLSITGAKLIFDALT